MNNIQLKEILSLTNLRKKYLRLIEIVDQIDPFTLIQEDKVVQLYWNYNQYLLCDLFNGTFDESLSTSSIRLLDKIFKQLYAKMIENLNLNTNKLTKEQEVNVAQNLLNFYIEHYIQALANNKNYYYLNTSQAINKVIAEMRPGAIIVILQHMNKIDPQFSQRHILWGFVSLLRFGKLCGEITYDSINQKVLSKSGLELELKNSTINQWLFNLDRAIQLETLHFIIDTNKITEPPTQFEYDNVLEFLNIGLRTSYPNYRKELLVQLKWFFERIRRTFEKELTTQQIKPTRQPQIDMLRKFLCSAVPDLYDQLFPDVAFELANPVLEVLKMIYTFLGNYIDIEIRKGYIIKPVQFLQQEAFTEQYFEQLLTQMSSSWESARVLSFEIISLFPQNLPYFTKERLQKLYNQGKIMIQDPVIRWFENGSYMLLWIFQRFTHLLFPNEKQHQLIYLQTLLQDFKQTYLKFKNVFSSDSQALQNNLIHGYIATFSVILERGSLQFFQSGEVKEFFSDLLDTLRSIIEFATKLSSDNICTWILNPPTQDGKIQVDQQTDVRDPNLNVDCRGHFYFQKEQKDEEQFKKNMETILQGNTLIEGLDTGEGCGDSMSENILVVAFYLATRESGSFFQSLAHLLEEHDKSTGNQTHIVETEPLRNITHQFFHALLNIKHIGSIDRIAQGLNQVAKVMCSSKSPQLPNLVNDLLDRLIQAFQQNVIKNIFRRSAGLPHVVNCLLKALNNSQRPEPLKKVVTTLFSFVDGDRDELKVHALNILKKLFQEGQIRHDMEPYVGQAFMKSVECFSYDDWSVRNSSLMLFSALAGRTIGRNTNSEKLCERKNFLEFFIKTPELVPFFLKQFNIFLSADNVPMYPSLYPIALLLSRLVPLDAQIQRTVQPVEEQKQLIVDLNQVQDMLQLLIKCSSNRNYLGRLMVSKAILPFLKFEEIPLWSAQLLEQIGKSIKDVTRNHNKTHGILQISYEVMKVYYKIREETARFYEKEQIDKFISNEIQLLKQINSMSFVCIDIKCAPVQTTFFHILNLLVKQIKFNSDISNYFQPFVDFGISIINQSFTQPSFRIKNDLGHSILRKKILSFILKLYGVHQVQTSIDYHLELINKTINKYIQDPQLLYTDDLEVLNFILKAFNKIIKKNPKILKINSKEVQKTIKLLQNLLILKEASIPSFSLAVQQALILFIKLQHNEFPFDDVEELSNLSILYIKQGHQQILPQAIRLLGASIALGNTKLDIANAYLKCCYQYSGNENLDDLRIAVIKSLILSHKVINHLFKTNPDISLGFYRVYIRMLQDEIPEIRQKVSKFLCWNSKKNTSQYLNFEYILTNLFNTKKLNASFQPLVTFLIEIIFDEEFTEVKRINHHQKKIFANEKSNKFLNEFKVSELAFQELLKINFQDKQENADFLSQKLQEISNKEFRKITLQDVQEYEGDFVKRDEYVFECLYKLVIFERLNNLIKKDYEFSQIFSFVKDKNNKIDSKLRKLIYTL